MSREWCLNLNAIDFCELIENRQTYLKEISLVSELKSRGENQYVDRVSFWYSELNACLVLFFLDFWRYNNDLG